jgi:flagellar basal body-associated protein FliL
MRNRLRRGTSRMLNNVPIIIIIIIIIIIVMMMMMLLLLLLSSSSYVLDRYGCHLKRGSNAGRNKTFFFSTKRPERLWVTQFPI